jgi:hypothetical protein
MLESLIKLSKHFLLVNVGNKRNDFVLGSRIVPPANSCHEKTDVFHASSPESISKMLVDQSSLPAANPPLKILDRVFRD